MVLYKCNLCSNKIKKLYGSKDKQASFLQCECTGVMERQLAEFSTTSVETIDNGNMARKVELRKDAVKHAKEKGEIYIKTMATRDRILKKDDE